MSSLVGRLFGRSSRALPSYAPTDAPTPRTFIGTTIYLATLFGSGWCAALLTNHYLLTWAHSTGPSMEPTLPASHSISLNSPLYRHGKGVKLGDIVNAKSPLLPRSMVGKRVVGMPGDYVLRDEKFAPTAGGAPIPGIYDKERTEPTMVQVPDGHVWLAGDNMGMSRDSRFYGPVPMALIESKVLYNGDGFASWESFRGPQLKPAGHLQRAMEVQEVATSGKVD